jgi:hypothetical protein
MEGVHRHRETGPGCDLRAHRGRTHPEPSLACLGASIDWLFQRAIVAKPLPLNERPAGVGPGSGVTLREQGASLRTCRGTRLP